MSLGLFRISFALLLNRFALLLNRFALLLNRSSVNDKVIAYFKLPISPPCAREKSVRSLADDPCLHFRKHASRSGTTGR